MTDAIDKIIEGVMAREGGYVERANDHGGATRYGVTLQALSAWRGTACTPDDVKALSAAEAHEILRREYVERPGFALIQNAALQELLVDIQVNHRPGKAAKFLQKALGVPQDGVIGPLTLSAINATVDVGAIYRKVCAERVRLYGRIITDDPSQAVFAAGWTNRIAEFIEKAAA